MSLSRSSMALQWSIEELIRRAHKPCGFYTVTLADLVDWREFGRRHGDLLDRIWEARRSGSFPRYAGVRVFEEGDKTKRPHAHWVLTPRVSVDLIQPMATAAGFGFVNRHPLPASEYVGMYLSKYLGKGKAMRGSRRWNTFGEFKGVKVKDVEIDSPEIRLFREVRQECIKLGMPNRQAYVEAVRRVNCAKYRIVAVTTQLAPSIEHVGKMDRTTIWSDGRVTRTIFDPRVEGSGKVTRL